MTDLTHHGISPVPTETWGRVVIVDPDCAGEPAPRLIPGEFAQYDPLPALREGGAI